MSYLLPRYREPDLIVSTSKALGSLDNAKVHELWSMFISSRGRCMRDMDGGFNLLRSSLRYVFPFYMCDSSLTSYPSNTSDSEISYLAARYFFHILNTPFEDADLRPFTSRMWPKYLLTAIYYPHMIEWENMDKCLRIGVPNRREVSGFCRSLTRRFEEGKFEK